MIVVEAVMLCGTTGKAESNDIYARLSNPPANPEEGIKLCYVTVRNRLVVHYFYWQLAQPEKIASNDRFLGLLTKMHAAGRLGMYRTTEWRPWLTPVFQLELS